MAKPKKKKQGISIDFHPQYYLQAYLLAEQGMTHKEVAANLKPPLDFDRYILFRKKDRVFERGIRKGRRKANPEGSQKMITHPRQQAFLIAFAEIGNVSKTIQHLGFSRSCHKEWIKASREGDGLYADCFEHAKSLYAHSLVQEAERRGRDGRRTYKFSQGAPVMIACDKTHPEAVEKTDRKGNVKWVRHYYEMVYSDVLLGRLLEAKVPEFKKGNQDTNVNVGVSLSVGDVLANVEQARSKIVDGDYVKKFAEESIRIEHQKKLENNSGDD